MGKPSKDDLLLCLALGSDAGKRVEKLPAATGKEQHIADKSRRNSPGRS